MGFDRGFVFMHILQHTLENRIQHTYQFFYGALVSFMMALRLSITYAKFIISERLPMFRWKKEIVCGSKIVSNHTTIYSYVT